MPQPGTQADLIAIAAVGKSRGLAGEVFLYPYFDISGESLAGVSAVLRWRDGRERILVIESLREVAGKILCHFRGIDSIDPAKELATADLYVKRTDLEPVDDDEFFIDDLLGLAVRTTQGRPLGAVSAIETGGAPLMRVMDGGREYLIPFAREIVVEVDPVGGVIVVDPPEGLLEINDN